MRTSAQLLALLLVCSVVCWLLSQQTQARPTIISGEVIDWSTGRPAPYTDIEVDRLNFSQPVARTDARGRFEFTAPKVPDFYFLFAASPRYGRLLQTTFGQTLFLHRKGEQLPKIIIPAIPATELSGHVYDESGHPITGCLVAAITRESIDPGKSIELNGGSVHSFFYGMPEADDPNKFMDIESEDTGSDGSYKFTRLGADRYFVLTRCHEADRVREAPKTWWEPTVYPQTNSIDKAQEIVLRPGEHRSGLDFHLPRKRTYTLQGKIVFSDGVAPRPWPEAIYSQEMAAFRTDRTVTSTYVGREACEIDANAGTFRCRALLPGTYTLYFDIDGGMGAARHMPDEFAKVTYTVQPKENQSLTVQLHNVPNTVSSEQSTGPRGALDLHKPCRAAEDRRASVQILAWGRWHSDAPCYFMTAFGQTLMNLPADTYTLNAFEAAFVHRRNRSYLGGSAKVEALLMRHGVSVQIRVGQRSEPELSIVPTSKLIDIALASLQPAQ